MQTFHFDHERLDVYRLSMEVARWVAATDFPRGLASLKDQAVRAAQSVVMNIAEGRGRGGDAAVARRAEPLPDRAGQRGGGLRGA